MTQITTRRAQASDLPEILKMIHALAAHHDDVSTLTLAALRRDVLGDAPWMAVLVAEGGAGLLGYAALCPLAQLQFGVRGMDIHHLFVQPKARGQGVAKQLVTDSISHSKAMGCRYIMVGTHPENTKAQKMYHAIGFSAAPAPGPRFRMKFDSS